MTQSLALNLADDLEASSLFPGNMKSCNNSAAAELRRLHNENEMLREQLALYEGTLKSRERNVETLIAENERLIRDMNGSAELVAKVNSSDGNYQIQWIKHPTQINGPLYTVGIPCPGEWVRFTEAERRQLIKDFYITKYTMFEFISEVSDRLIAKNGGTQ